MAVSILEGFDYGGPLPNFSRDLFETVADMVAFSEDYLPPVFECNVKENGKRYRFNVSNSVDPELGKWREASSGDADLSNYYTKKEIDENIIEPLEEKVDANAENIGDLSTLEVTTWTDLVTAVNGLYNSLLSSITYTVESSKKILRLTYRNSETKDIDISAIVGEVKLSELSDVDSLNVLDGNVLAYDNASSKFKPKDLKLGELLQTAKDYTDEQIAESEKASAMDCDEKPTYDDATGEIISENRGKITISNINEKISDMEALGYEKDDILKMTKRQPSIYSVGISNIKENKDNSNFNLYML